MKPMLRIGIAIEETWAFFKEIYADLQDHHQVTLFKRRRTAMPVFQDRTNQRLFTQDLQRLLESNQVVFFEWASELLAAASHLPKTCGIVTRLHRYEMYRWADQINWEAVDRIILVTEAKRQEFDRLFPGHAEKLIVIPEAVSLERFQPFDKPFNGDIGTLCNLIPRKRVYELILAFHELSRRVPGLQLHVGGSRHDNFAEYFHALHDLTRRLGLQEQIRFYGQVNDPPAWYHNLDIFVSNSYSEGLQVALCEAMASGIYSLSHWWEGAEEILPPGNLYFTEHELVKRIEEYLIMSESERSVQKAEMRRRVTGVSDIEQIKGEIRRVIEAVGVNYETRSGKSQ
jgi:glycosyltransferase involved in cell wall biosynthesis